MQPHPIRVPGAAPFRLYTHQREDAYISRELETLGVWEPYESQLVLERLRPGSVFLDLGANIGYYTVLASQAVGSAGRVIAFEPEPGNFELLRRNAELNGLANATLVQAAASDQEGWTELYLSDTNQGDHRLYRNDGREKAVRVATHALDRWFATQDPRVDLVKMDTQGFETQILRGMRGLLEANAGHLHMILEFWPFGLRGAGSDAADLIGLLEPYPFRVRKIDEFGRKLVPVTWADMRRQAVEDYHPSTGFFTNLLLSPAGD